MMIEVLKSKIHCARVTEANLNYMGSITIDEDLMDAANMIAGEKVYIADNNNGERFETYIIKGERGSGKICLNGAAARKVQPDDIVIIMSYALMDFEEAKSFNDGDFPRPGNEQGGEVVSILKYGNKACLQFICKRGFVLLLILLRRVRMRMRSRFNLVE